MSTVRLGDGRGSKAQSLDRILSHAQGVTRNAVAVA